MKERYYVGINLRTGEIAVSTNMISVARMLGIHQVTVKRHLDGVKSYKCEDYILWKDVPLLKRRTGFALKKRWRRY